MLDKNRGIGEIADLVKWITVSLVILQMIFLGMPVYSLEQECESMAVHSCCGAQSSPVEEFSYASGCESCLSCLTREEGAQEQSEGPLLISIHIPESFELSHTLIGVLPVTNPKNILQSKEVLSESFLSGVVHIRVKQSCWLL